MVKLKIFSFILLLNFSLAQYKFAIIPFDDLSGFKGKWNLKVEVPRYLGDFILKFYGVEVLPIDSVIGMAKGLDFKDAFLFSELNKKFGVEHIISGKVLTFKISRFTTGFPLMAGYESYNAEVDIEVEIYNALTGERNVIFGILGEVKERGLGLTLLGKPTDRYSEFYSLDFLKFGSNEFNKTIIGEAMRKAGMEFALRLKRYFPEIISGFSEAMDISGTTELKVSLVEGTILQIGKQNIVYVNLGSEDGIVAGMTLFVFDDGEKIGELEVVDVVNEHFSSCKVINSTAEIKKGNKVKARVVK
ncbi:hypothetical protein JGI13_01525 [Candidatus Kryptonium thompsonii]|nr:hypothetical protein JGI13_01525 [Candidatus Kryptonium thompsoni]CUT08126.1 hypothetical protein JGI9_01346 [Candidatus Kryptonium thompsoni]